MFRDIWVVMRKELMDLSRDKRTIRSMVGILMGLPLMYVLLIGVMQSQFNDQMERTIQAGVIGCDQAEEICGLLRENRVEVTTLEKADLDLLANHSLDLILAIPKDYSEKFSSFRQPKLQVWYDESEDKSSFALKRVRGLMESFQSTQAYRRAILRGVDPHILRAVDIELRSIRPEKKGFGYGALQLFISSIMMACFMGTYHLSVDSIAGEKERNTLESLMQTATSRLAFLLGKWLTVALVGMLGVVASGLMFKIVMEAGPLQSWLGTSSVLTWRFVCFSFLICVPLVLLATAMQFTISTLSRSVKEAQAYVSIISLLGILPASFTSVLEKMSSAVWLPNMGQALALIRMGKDQPVNTLALVSTSGLTLVLTAILLGILYRCFHSEKLFRTGT